MATPQRETSDSDKMSNKAKMLPPMPLLSISSKETIQKCASLPLQSTDIFICSYPKSGTTWTQHICLSLLLKHNENLTGNGMDYDHVSEYAPFFEIDAHWEQGQELLKRIRDNHKRIGRRVFNTHLRFDMLPGGRPAKFIYLVRRPLDACVSFHCHLNNQVEGGYEGSFDDFYQEWLDGRIPFGSWIQHIQSYAHAFSHGSTSPNTPYVVKLEDGRHLLLLSYDEMKDNLLSAVCTIQLFLNLNVTEEQRLGLLPAFSFESMKKDIHKFQPRSVHWKHGFSFLRKGVSGDSHTGVSSVQRKSFWDCVARENLRENLSELLTSKPELYQTFVRLLKD